MIFILEKVIIMHELGIVFHIAKTIEEVAEENNVKHINKVVLQVGEVSSVIPDYLTDCWNWNAKKTELLNGCVLENEPIKAVTHCDDCGDDYPTVEYGKTCPYCGSENTYLLTGNEVLIKEIIVDD